MQKLNSKIAFFTSFLCLIFIVSANFKAIAQTIVQRAEPELTAAGFRLGEDEEKIKSLLQGYSPRYDNESGQPKFFFYNGYGNQVMSLTGYSRERPFLIVAIEVFSVGESYQKTHYQLKDKNSFMTESGFFIGERPSVTSLMFAVPNVTRPNSIIKKKGTPDTDEKVKNVRTISYRFDAAGQMETPQAKTKGINFSLYTAQYRFVKNKLSRFTIAIDTKVSALPTLSSSVEENKLNN
jgi:hypothetical protein